MMALITARHRQPSVTESSVALPPQYRSIQGESTVSSTQQFLTAIERPRCPRCQTRMMLERVSSGPIGFEHRLFECPKCDHVEISVTASDPFKSNTAWLARRRTQSTELRERRPCSTDKPKARNAPPAVHP